MLFRRTWIRAAPIACLGVLFSCGGAATAPTTAAMPTASWLRRLPLESRSESTWIEPSPARWVPDAAIDRAASLLEIDRAAEVSADEAVGFGAAAWNVDESPRSRWYLLRGIEILGEADRSGDGLFVRAGEGRVVVTTLGHRPWPGSGTRNRAVVVRMQEPPGELYTDVQVAYVDGLTSPRLGSGPRSRARSYDEQ